MCLDLTPISEIFSSLRSMPILEVAPELSALALWCWSKYPHKTLPLAYQMFARWIAHMNDRKEPTCARSGIDLLLVHPNDVRGIIFKCSWVLEKEKLYSITLHCMLMIPSAICSVSNLSGCNFFGDLWPKIAMLIARACERQLCCGNEDRCDWMLSEGLVVLRFVL